MKQTWKFGIISISFHLSFIVFIYILDYAIPGQRYAPSGGIFAIWAWYIYTELILLRTIIMYFLDGMKERKISLMILTVMTIFLTSIYCSYPVLEYFLDDITRF